MCRPFLATVAAGLADGTFAASGLGRHQMPYVTASVRGWGNVWVGLEDNLMLNHGVLVSNAQLVDRAIGIVEWLGAQVIGPVAVRGKQGLRKQETAR